MENSDEVLVPRIAGRYLEDNDDYCDIVRLHTTSARGWIHDTSHFVNLLPREYKPSIRVFSTILSPIDNY